MNLEKEKQPIKKQLWSHPNIKTISVEELNAKVIASACSEYTPECDRCFFR